MIRDRFTPLAILRAFVGASVVLLLCGLFVPALSKVHDFLIGAATGVLIGAFVQLMALDSVTTKDDVHRRESELQSLRLS
ncbi:hypothetical protein [Silvibacterium dinghuense]|uniref:Uncharacterized protein n=1 Tax=Silvibacterium dinghuense TaxID=1560006 RepID=A0A4Q1SDQ0_9BACT|nr:hypothetical protein [Silvibacterium dinghuense]RXS95362.1 hypothetical protein ESZ00_12330 [Silvibacterium dinghuense]GGH12679.1 hypothetical protein GCM10011586_32100 [Silvibacterium dinghuense]